MNLSTDELPPRQGSLLIFLNDPMGRAIDPVRVMKGLFIIAQESPSTWLPDFARYPFQPYHYGPCSFDIYEDLEALELEGLVAAPAIQGVSWKKFSLTPAGVEAAHVQAAKFEPALVKYIESVRNFVLSLSFRDLLTAVYSKYPEFAANSIFQR